MKLLFLIVDEILNSEFADKAAGIGGGATASVLTFISSGFGDFALKCFAAIVFAILGGLFGYLGKKFGEHFFNKYKNKKNKNRKK